MKLPVLERVSLLRWYSYALSLWFSLGLMFVAQAQTSIDWDRTFGGSNFEELNETISTPDGGYLLVGSTSSPNDGEVTEASRGGVDFWIVKIDIDGNKIWDRRYGGSGTDRAYDATVSIDGGIFIAGESDSGIGGEKSTNSFGNLDYWLIKIDANGNFLWDRTYGGWGSDYLHNIHEKPNGNLVFFGYSFSGASGIRQAPAQGPMDTWVFETDVSGNIIWEQAYGGDGVDPTFEALATSDGGYLIGINSQSPISGNKTTPLYGANDIWLVKINSIGTIEWQRSYGGADRDEVYEILELSDGNFLLGGYSASVQDSSTTKLTPSFGLEDYWLIKVDPTGNELWQRSFGGAAYDQIYGIRENGAGQLMLTGVSASGAEGTRTKTSRGLRDYWLIFCNPDGSEIWQVAFGGALEDSPVNIHYAINGGYIIAGVSASDQSDDKSENSRGFNDIWVVKTFCPLVAPEIAGDTMVCVLEEVTLDATVQDCDACIYEWSDGFSEPVRTLIPTSTRDFAVNIKHSDGCEADAELTLAVNSNPIMARVSVQGLECSEEDFGAISVDTVRSGSGPFLFALDDQPFSTSSAFINLNVGTYLITIEDINGCTTDTTVTINPPSGFEVDLGPDLELSLGDSIQLELGTNQGIDSILWQRWDSTQFSCMNCLNPVVKPEETTYLRVVAYNEFGCRAISDVRIVVNKARPAFIPTAFSPNNDGNNDRFTVYGSRAVEKVKKMLVFDRWGQLVFERYDFKSNNEALGWDGNLDGRPLNPQAFVYLIELEYVDESTELFSGEVMLVR